MFSIETSFWVLKIETSIDDFFYLFDLNFTKLPNQIIGIIINFFQNSHAIVSTEYVENRMLH
jgi:hypothetical protein